MPLYVARERIATFKINISCRLDSVQRYLAVEESSYFVHADVDNAPIFRFEYVRDMNSAPTGHVHVHAHRGALSHLLSRAGHSRPHDMSALHIPVGGSRFRPCLEDVIQFLLHDCMFDACDGWKRHVEQGRERWRRRQAAAVSRDMPDEAARALTDLGYQVTPPAIPPQPSAKALRSW